MIIGLSGYARSGKDSAADALVRMGFQRVAFADKLREFLYRLNPVVIPRGQSAFGPHNGAELLSIIIDKYGWDNYKTTTYGPHIREYLQRLGTECGRELISDTVWIDAALGDSHIEYDLVVTDVRFPNEAEAIKERGGYVVRIERPGVTAPNDHYSEHALADWKFDHILHNDGTLADWHNRVAWLPAVLTKK